jgi:hypothetical protein
MAIAASDIKIRLSVKTGSAGNSSTSSGPASLGKYISTTDVPTNTNQFFNQVSGTENAGSVTKYRCFFVYNSHATLTLMNAVVWLQGGDPPGGTAVTLAVDPTAASAVGSATAQALEAASETAPGSSVTSLSYSAPSSSTSGLSLGNIGPGQVKAVWMKQAAQNSTAVTETVSIAVTGSTLA